jgi:hypothetical protein
MDKFAYFLIGFFIFLTGCYSYKILPGSQPQILWVWPPNYVQVGHVGKLTAGVAKADSAQIFIFYEQKPFDNRSGYYYKSPEKKLLVETKKKKLEYESQVPITVIYLY